MKKFVMCCKCDVQILNEKKRFAYTSLHYLCNLLYINSLRDV